MTAPRRTYLIHWREGDGALVLEDVQNRVRVRLDHPSEIGDQITRWIAVPAEGERVAPELVPEPPPEDAA